MMNLSALKIDPEFQGKIPPLTFEELNQLESNILRDGRIINPIIVWQGLIVDGHNRYTIAKKHPEIPFTVHEKAFANRYEAIIWICKNQLGRRNLTPEQKKYLIGKQYDAEKAISFHKKSSLHLLIALASASSASVYTKAQTRMALQICRAYSACWDAVPIPVNITEP